MIFVSRHKSKHTNQTCASAPCRVSSSTGIQWDAVLFLLLLPFLLYFFLFWSVLLHFLSSFLSQRSVDNCCYHKVFVIQPQPPKP